MELTWYLMFQPKILYPMLAPYRILLLFVFFRLSGKGKVADPVLFSFPSSKEEGMLKDRDSRVKLRIIVERTQEGGRRSASSFLSWTED